MALKTITTRIAGSIPSRLQALGFTNLEQTATESEQLYKMLFSRRMDAIVGDTDLGVHYYVKRLGFDDATLEKVPIEIFRSELYIAFSPDSDDQVVNSWTKAVKSLKDSGALKQIFLRYE